MEGGELSRMYRREAERLLKELKEAYVGWVFRREALQLLSQVRSLLSPEDFQLLSEYYARLTGADRDG